MEIRSLTVFCDPQQTETAALQPLLTAARTAFTYPLQTTRVATTPFPDWWPRQSVTAFARETAARWQEAGADYVSLGPVLLRHDADWLELIPALLSVGDTLFATAEIADGQGVISMARCHHVAGIIRRISRVKADGFGNLYFAALAGCAGGAPYFPVAYHGGGAPHFAIAVEAADLALTAVQTASTLAEARANLVMAIETAAAAITETAVALASEYAVPFSGIDFSLAPFPDDDKSLGAAMEALGVPHVGGSGSLFAAAFITDAINRAHFPRCGFSGLMLPVLEDSVLARRAATSQLRLQDLLSYAAVCGVGLDTIPLPGEVTEAQLAAVLLDVAALSARLRKPLTARLMPLPGLAAGDAVQFDFPYFANGRVMAIDGDGAAGLLAQAKAIAFTPYRGDQT